MVLVFVLEITAEGHLLGLNQGIHTRSRVRGKCREEGDCIINRGILHPCTVYSSLVDIEKPLFLLGTLGMIEKEVLQTEHFSFDIFH